MIITDAMVEAAARSDAAFDGRDFDALGRADKRRYLDRSRKALEAATKVNVEIKPYHNHEAGYAEFANHDGPYIARDIEGSVAVLVEPDTRKIMGYRVYDKAARE